MRHITLAATLAAALASPLMASAADLITNGDFESATLGAGWSSTATTGFAPILSYNNCCAPLTGTYTGGLDAAFFGWDNQTGGTIWQDIATVAGQTYTLSFDYGAIVAPQLQTLSAQALFGSTSLGLLNVSATGTRALDQMLSTYSLSFVAQGAQTRILFSDTSAITVDTDGVLDNVAVIGAVPEPETYALMLAGLGAMAFVARRRKA